MNGRTFSENPRQGEKAIVKCILVSFITTVDNPCQPCFLYFMFKTLCLWSYVVHLLHDSVSFKTTNYNPLQARLKLCCL